MKSYSIAEARNKFAAVVHDVENNSAIELTRHGEPVAMIISVEEYKILKEGKKDFWQAHTEWLAKRGDGEAIGFTPEELEGLRDPSPGREVDLWD